jgi:hypothetical protein
MLTLARAFQLMTQALSEFRSPVGQEALRLRMVAMHGKEDALLDVARFPRLLRQANDAEVADVRKVGENDYEIAAQRSAGRPAPTPTPAPEESASSVPVSDATPDVAGLTGPRENGQRQGLRFRRGSRGPTRAADIPLIGVVEVEPAPEPVVAAPEAAAEVVEQKPPRPRRPPRKRARAVQAEAVAEDPASESPPPAPRRPRPRARAKKKSE